MGNYVVHQWVDQYPLHSLLISLLRSPLHSPLNSIAEPIAQPFEPPEGIHGSSKGGAMTNSVVRADATPTPRRRRCGVAQAVNCACRVFPAPYKGSRANQRAIQWVLYGIKGSIECNQWALHHANQNPLIRTCKICLDPPGEC